MRLAKKNMSSGILHLFLGECFLNNKPFSCNVFSGYCTGFQCYIFCLSLSNTYADVAKTKPHIVIASDSDEEDLMTAVMGHIKIGSLGHMQSTAGHVKSTHTAEIYNSNGLLPELTIEDINNLIY